MPDPAKRYDEAIARYYRSMESALLHRDKAMLVRASKAGDDEETEAAVQESFQALEQVREIGLEIGTMLGQVRPDQPSWHPGLN